MSRPLKQRGGSRLTQCLTPDRLPAGSCRSSNSTLMQHLMVMQHDAWLKAYASLCRGLQSITQLQAEEEHRANKASEISAAKQGDIEQLTVRIDRRLCFSQDDSVHLLVTVSASPPSTGEGRYAVWPSPGPAVGYRLSVVVVRLHRLLQNLSIGFFILGEQDLRS